MSFKEIKVNVGTVRKKEKKKKEKRKKKKPEARLERKNPACLTVLLDLCEANVMFFSVKPKIFF